jgi:tRNA-specific 2-thiouridylase
LGLVNADKPESQEICFVPQNNYAAFVAHNAPPNRIRPGSIRDLSGRELARHRGVHQFTIGQRRGLGIAGAAPLYVRSIDAATGDITVGQRHDLVSAGLIAQMVRWTNPQSLSRGEISVGVKIRYRHPPLPASVRMLGEARAQVRFENGGPMVTPGQACVFYRGDEVLGGGIIEAATEH